MPDRADTDTTHAAPDATPEAFAPAGAEAVRYVFAGTEGAPDAEAAPRESCDLSVVIPTPHEAVPAPVLAELGAILASAGMRYELLVARITGGDSPVAAPGSGPEPRGYGEAILHAGRAARGDYVLTLDPTQEVPLQVVRALWASRRRADVVVASRYVPGGGANGPITYRVLSRGLNAVLRRALSLGTYDLTNGVRLYRRAVLHDLRATGHDFAILPETLVRAHTKAYTVAEVPVTCSVRERPGWWRGKRRVGADCLRALGRMWRVRNSVASADYDDRAYSSRIWPQRWWQRRRVRAVTALVPPAGRILDAGCGTSKIIQCLPHAVALDFRLERLRFLSGTNPMRACGDGCRLPFADGTFDCVISSQVIEHVRSVDGVDPIGELVRVLAPAGRLVIGTPDYAWWMWRVTERIYDWVVPGGYAEEHVTHYTAASLRAALEAAGLRYEHHLHFGTGELIMVAAKP